MTKQIILPRYLTIEHTYYFVSQSIGDDREPLHQEICFDFARVTFIDGAGFTVFCNTIEWLHRRGVKVSFSNHRSGSSCLAYMDDCGFFQRYLGSKLNAWARTRPTSLPIRSVRHANSFDWIENTAGPWIAECLGTSNNKLDDVRVCLKEAFNNIRDHSAEDTGFIHVQHYPNRNVLGLTISDLGNSIPAVIKRKFKVNNDGTALELAITEGISTKEDRVSGFGLSTLTKYSVLASQGQVRIYSGNGRLHCRNRQDKLAAESSVGTGCFPGTLVDIEFRTDVLIMADDDEPGDIEW